ncbi:hydrolase [Pseudomonadota bacterium]
MTNNQKECCPKFNSERWNNKTHEWNNKQFIKESIPTLFHIPFPPMIGAKITKMCKVAEESGKACRELSDVLMLFHDPSPFKSEIFMSVEGPVPTANNVQISGTFISRVFDGPYNATPKFIKEMDEYLAADEKKAKDYYVHYAYCPGCAKKFGHNYTVLFAEV